MAFLKVEHIAVDGIAACVPKNVVKSTDFPFATDFERETFVKGTGVEELRMATDGVCASDLCFEAGEKLLDDLKINRDEVKILLFVSQSPDYFLPATAIILQQRLQLSKNCMAFDVGLGCSGYVYGLSVAANLLQNMQDGKALLLVGDHSTFSSNPKDKSTRPLFGDAGTATLLSKKMTADPIFFNLQSDGSGYESIIIRGGGTRKPYRACSLENREVEPGIWRNDLSLEMDGVEVFNFALREVKKNILDTIEFAQKKSSELDYFVLHQANKFMNETVRKKMKIEPEKVPYSIQKFGNTSSASIPLTMVTQLAQKLENESLNLLLCGFGVGFSWGSAYLSTSKVKIIPLIEL